MFTRGIKVPKSYYPFLGLIVLYLIWGIFEVINFRVTTNIKVPILGFIVHFYFIPLIFLVPMLLDSQEKILKFIKMVPYISIPIFMLGVVQYFSPHSSVINRYVDKDMPVAAIGEFVRITGVFSYISPYTTYLVGSLMLILYLVIVIRGINKRDILVIYIALALGIVNIIMTGSRGAVIGFLIQAVPFLVLSLRGKIRLRKKIIFRFMLALPLLIVFLVFTDKGSKALDAFVERTKNVHYDVIPRIIDNYTPFKFLPEAGLIGYGIGTAYQGATNLVTDWKDMPRNFEEEWERIVLEIGLIGFIIVISIRVYLAFYSLKAWRKIKTYELKNLALLILLSQTTILMGLNIIFNPLQTIFYWFFIGLLIAVLRAEKNNETQRSSIPSG